MKATNTILIAFSAAAIVLSGCSRDNRVTGPGNGDTPEIDKNLVESTTPAVTENNTARIAVSSFDREIKRTGFEATVKKSDVEGGCLYLETEKTERYTPYFEEGTPIPSVGQQLFVSGYVDENMSSYCMIGQVFHVEKYTLLWRNDYGSEVGGEADGGSDEAVNSRSGYILDTVIGMETSDPVPGSDGGSDDPVNSRNGYILDTVIGMETSDPVPGSDGGSDDPVNSRNGYILDTVIGMETSDPVPSSDGSAAIHGGSDNAANSRNGYILDDVIRRETSDPISGSSGSAAANGGTDDAASDDAASQDDLTALTGYYFTNDAGCEYITDGKAILAELQFNWLRAPLIPNGTLISVRGEYSLLTWSPCLLAQLFYVEEFEALDSNHYVAEAGRAGK